MRELTPFGGGKSVAGTSIRFYTKTKAVACRWPTGIKDGVSFLIQTMA